MFRILHLTSLFRLTSELFHELVDLRNTRRTHRMAFCLEPAGCIDWKPSIDAGFPFRNRFPGLSSFKKPELCTVYGNLTMTGVPCDPSAFYGASWIFQRYLADQFGPSYPGGLVQFTRDWVQKNPSLSGSANIQALTGANYDTLFVRFSAALALDDRNNGTGTGWIPPALAISSWNSDSIATYIASCCSWGWLDPPVMTFTTASSSRSVRGGSTAYLLLSAAAGHAATAIQFTDQGGAVLSGALRPALWVARIQ